MCLWLQSLLCLVIEPFCSDSNDRGKERQSQNFCAMWLSSPIRIGPLVPSSDLPVCQKSSWVELQLLYLLMEPQQNGGRGGVSALAHSLIFWSLSLYNLHLVAPVSCPQGQTSFSCHSQWSCFPRPPCNPKSIPSIGWESIRSKDGNFRLIPRFVIYAVVRKIALHLKTGHQYSLGKLRESLFFIFIFMKALFWYRF